MAELIVLVGFPASGKSTWMRQNLGAYKLVSKDLMGSNKAKQQARALEKHFTANESVMLDNTNISIVERSQVIVIAKAHGVKIKVVWFPTPFETCMERNAKREGKAKAPAVAMYGMRKRFAEPTLAEGIDEIVKIEQEILLSKTVKAVTQQLQKSAQPRPAIFLDKDGVLVDDSDYPYIIPKATLIPGVEEALIKLSKQNLPIIVISNQSWVAKGRLTMAEVEGIFEELKQKVAAFGGRIDATYFCPHQPKDKCVCRKPGIGILLKAADEHNIKLCESTLVGDMHTDIECGEKAGIPRRVIVKNGEDKKDSNPTHMFPTLLEAVNALYP